MFKRIQESNVFLFWDYENSVVEDINDRIYSRFIVEIVGSGVDYGILDVIC